MSHKVSVVMAVYNGSRYLRESVESVLNQSYSDFEFIIIDDGSTDDSWQILTQYVEGDRRIQLVKNEANIGLTKSLNKGLKLATGDYVARQDADDISLPQRLEKQVKLLEEQPETILVSSNYEYINEEGLSFGKPRLADDPILIAWYLLFYNRIGAHGLAMFRRELVVAIDGYDENYRYSQDYELWSRLIKLGKVVILPEYLQLYRRNHSESISVSSKSTQEDLALAVTRKNITQLIGKQLSWEEIIELKRFWLHEYPDRQRINIFNANLQKIYIAFLQEFSQHQFVGLESRDLIRQIIGKRFCYWINSVDGKQELYTKIKVSVYGVRWCPLTIINFWRGKIYRAVLRVVSRLNRKFKIGHTEA